MDQTEKIVIPNLENLYESSSDGETPESILIGSLENLLDKNRIIESEKAEKRGNKMQELHLKMDPKIDLINKQIEQLIKEKSDLEKELQNEYETYAKMIEKEYPRFNDRFVSVLLEVMNNDEIFFPEGHDVISMFRETDPEIFAKETGLTGDVSIQVQKWINDNVELTPHEALQQGYGRMKGYKGDETYFKVDTDESPYIKNSDAEPYRGIEWENYFGEDQPNRRDVEWPDHKSTMAYCTFKCDVVLVSLKEVKE